MQEQGNNSDHKMLLFIKKTQATFQKKLTKYLLLVLNLNIISFYFFIDFVKNWFPIFYISISK